MSKTANSRRDPGRGVVRAGNMRRIVVLFPPDTFYLIRSRAIKENTSFAEQVRILTEWGLEADEDK